MPQPPHNLRLNLGHSPSPAVAAAPSCSCTNKLLTEVAALVQQKAAFGATATSNFQPQRYSRLFVEHLVDEVHCTSEQCRAQHDDLLWYVPVAQSDIAANALNGSAQVLQVFRRQSKNKPATGDRSINWEETVGLNVILQQFEYTVTCAVCVKNSPSNLQVLRKQCQRVFPSPSRRRMDVKGDREEITYPKLYFAIDDFEQVFSDLVISEGECVCVELVARDRLRDRRSVIFIGSIRYAVLQQQYDARASSTWTWAQKLMTSTNRRHEFVKMRGPHGKGFAEMAIARVASCGFETPMSEQGGYEGAFGDEAAVASRRMSDTNVFNRIMSKRSALTPGPSAPLSFGSLRRMPRWSNDADSVNNDADARSVTGSETASMGSSWSIKGIGQALTWLRTKPEDPALNAFLTYVTLPWRSILEDMLVNPPRRPLLTFELDMLNNTS